MHKNKLQESGRKSLPVQVLAVLLTALLCVSCLSGCSSGTEKADPQFTAFLEERNLSYEPEERKGCQLEVFAREESPGYVQITEYWHRDDIVTEIRRLDYVDYSILPEEGQMSVLGYMQYAHELAKQWAYFEAYTEPLDHGCRSVIRTFSLDEAYAFRQVMSHGALALYLLDGDSSYLSMERAREMETGRGAIER